MVKSQVDVQRFSTEPSFQLSFIVRDFLYKALRHRRWLEKHEFQDHERALLLNFAIISGSLQFYM